MLILLLLAYWLVKESSQKQVEAVNSIRSRGFLVTLLAYDLAGKSSRLHSSHAVQKAHKDQLLVQGAHGVALARGEDQERMGAEALLLAILAGEHPFAFQHDGEEGGMGRPVFANRLAWVQAEA